MGDDNDDDARTMTIMMVKIARRSRILMTMLKMTKMMTMIVKMVMTGMKMMSDEIVYKRGSHIHVLKDMQRNGKKTEKTTTRRENSPKTKRET